jgi:Fe-S cluster assembly protein SufD
MTAPFPTRAQEEWRYADLDALQARLGAGERARADRGCFPVEALELLWLPTDDRSRCGAFILTLGSHAKARIFALNIAGQYGRVELRSSCRKAPTSSFTPPISGRAFRPTKSSATSAISSPMAARAKSVRSVLGGKAVGTYLGRVAVARGAQQTDGEQSVKAVLLDRGATANAKPELEIYADDVKCAHGATVGELDPAQMFYATSRGCRRPRLAHCFSKASSWACGTDRRRGEARGDFHCRPRRASEGFAMNAPARIDSALNVRDQFPGIADWHYLDSAATAQKPQGGDRRDRDAPTAPNMRPSTAASTGDRAT